MRSFYHNPEIGKALCVGETGTLLVYSKVGTFIFLLITLTFIFRSAIIVHYPFSKSNILFHTFLITTFVIFLYFCPEYVQVTLEGLSLEEMGICMGIALGIVILGFVTRAAIQATGMGKIFHFEILIGDK